MKKDAPMAKRSRGDGGIDQRGENVFRLRYRVDGRRFAKTFHGTLTEARKELRALIRSADTGQHVAPERITVWKWCEQWIAAGAPGRKRKRVGQKTLERYAQLLRTHVKPKFENRALQQLKATEIDELYEELGPGDNGEAGKISPMTLHHLHVVFNSCLSTAVRKGLLGVSPMARIEKAPGAPEGDHGLALDEDDLKKLVAGFKTSTALYPIVALTAATGMRRNEVLALEWDDFDPEQKTIKVVRALEHTKRFGLRLKAPKTWRGTRTVALDPATVALLVRHRETHQRLFAGVPDGAEVDLSMVRLPAGALMFPNPPGPGEDVSFTKHRDPHTFTKQFRRQAKKLGFADFWFHHLRGTHATLLLDKNMPPHQVAERIGDDTAVLLKSYAKRKRNQTADASMANAIGQLAAGFLDT
jgi:integrase